MTHGPMLVTGASGLVGRSVLAHLALRGVEAVGVSRHGSAAARILSCDLTDAAAVSRLVKVVRPVTIVHLAWVTEH